MTYEEIESAIERMREEHPLPRKAFKKKIMETFEAMFQADALGFLDLCRASAILDRGCSKKTVDALHTLAERAREHYELQSALEEERSGGESYDDARHSLAEELLAYYVEHEEVTLEDLEERLFALGVSVEPESLKKGKREKTVIIDTPAFYEEEE